MTPTPVQQVQNPGVAPPPVMTSDQIMQHVDSVYQGLPDPVKAALDHAHTLTGGSPGSGVGDATKLPPPVPQPMTAVPSAISPGMVGVHPRDLAAPPIAAPVSSPASSVAPPPVDSYAPMGGLSDTGAPGPATIPGPSPSPHQVKYNELTAPSRGRNDPLAHTAADTGRPGVGQIHNPWLRGLATAGDVIASGVFPRFGQFIPGTSGYHNNLVAQQKGALGEEQAGAKSAAEVAGKQAETKLTEAQIPHVEAETAALGNPKDEFALFHQQNPTGTVTDFVKQQESGKNPTSPYQIWSREPANAGKGYMDFLKAEATTKPPANELELYVKTHPDEANPLAGYEHEKQNITSKPLTKETADALNANYNTLAKQYKGIPADQFHEGMTSAEATQIKAAMLGAIAGTQKGQNITINQGKADTAAATKRDAETSKEFVRVNKRLTTGYDKLQGQMDNLDAAEKEISGTAPAQALGIIKSIVATAGGQGSGVRITQAELNSLTKARNLGDSFEAWLQKFGSGKSLAPEQVTQIRDMLSGIRETANAKHQQYLDSLDRLNGARSVQDVRQIESEFNHAQSGGSAKPIGSKADYDALPKGASYIDADGKTYTKK